MQTKTNCSLIFNINKIYRFNKVSPLFLKYRILKVTLVVSKIIVSPLSFKLLGNHTLFHPFPVHANWNYISQEVLKVILGTKKK